MTKNSREWTFVLCIENRDAEDLDKRKIYRVMEDEDAESEGYIRVIDDSGEDYLYPASYFVPIQVPVEAMEALGVEG